MTDEEKDPQQEGQDEPDRVLAITSYDSNAALRNKNVAAEKAAENKSSDSSDSGE